MEYKDQVQIITNIEKNVPVNLLSYKNTTIWPIVRLLIWQNIFDGPQTSGNSHKKKSTLKRLAKFLNRFLTKKNHYIKSDAVFLVAPNERRAQVDNKYYSPFSNSLQDLLIKMNVSSATLDLDKKKLPVYGNTYFLDKETIDSPIRRQLIKVWNKYFSKSEDDIVGWNQLISYMQATCPEHIPSKSQVINYCENVFRYENIFIRILKKIKPKIAFLVCYYHPAAMGYIKACRNLGIKTVEVQHGDQYGMYRDWTNLPENGYELLPTMWWCWGKESADKINEWSNPVHPEHKAFVGGNPWVSRFVNSAPKNISKNKKNGIINVLVALTSMPYSVENVISAITNSADSTSWTIRPHPAMMNQAEKFSKLKNTTIQNPSLVPLFETLQNANFIITPCSTVAYEALVFKVHPIITHPDGLEKFQSYIQKGYFSYAETGSEIIEILQKDKTSFNFDEEFPYIETNFNIIQENLLRLVQ